MAHTFLQIHPDDNVLVALQNLPKGEQIVYKNTHFDLKTDIAAKHKFTTTPLSIGDEVRMYGVLVGKAAQPIDIGGLISTENLKHAAQTFGERQKGYVWQPPDVSRWQERTFMGYHRADGQVGTRNFWLVIPDRKSVV